MSNTVFSTKNILETLVIDIPVGLICHILHHSIIFLLIALIAVLLNALIHKLSLTHADRGIIMTLHIIEYILFITDIIFLLYYIVSSSIIMFTG